MENYVTVYDQNSSLTIIMLIGFCYFKFFVHEGELGLIHALTVTAPTCILDWSTWALWAFYAECVGLKVPTIEVWFVRIHSLR